MITYFTDKSHKSKKKNKKYKSLTSMLESVDTNVIIGTTTASAILSVTVIGLIVVPISAGSACALSCGNTKLHKLVLNNYNKYKNKMKKTNKS